MTINLSLFLRNIADSLEQDKLNPNELKLVGEFYMSYKFQTEVIEKTNDMEELKNIDVEDGDFIKFLILGWYIYCVILKDENYLKIQDKIYEKNDIITMMNENDNNEISLKLKDIYNNIYDYDYELSESPKRCR